MRVILGDAKQWQASDYTNYFELAVCMSFPASIFNFAPVIALIIQENYMLNPGFLMSITQKTKLTLDTLHKNHEWNLHLLLPYHH